MIHEEKCGIIPYYCYTDSIILPPQPTNNITLLSKPSHSLEYFVRGEYVVGIECGARYWHKRELPRYRKPMSIAIMCRDRFAPSEIRFAPK